ALLRRRVQDPIAAAETDLVLASGGAPVAVMRVPVVALLTGGDDPVTATGWPAVRIAAVAVDQIAVVAPLAAARVAHAVATHVPGLVLARRRAAVAAPPVAVVTLLAGGHDAVAAGGSRAA